jgi:hypothetical protein
MKYAASAANASVVIPAPINIGVLFFVAAGAAIAGDAAIAGAAATGAATGTTGSAGAGATAIGAGAGVAATGSAGVDGVVAAGIGAGCSALAIGAAAAEGKTAEPQLVQNFAAETSSVPQSLQNDAIHPPFRSSRLHNGYCDFPNVTSRCNQNAEPKPASWKRYPFFKMSMASTVNASVAVLITVSASGAQ